MKLRNPDLAVASAVHGAVVHVIEPDAGVAGGLRALLTSHGLQVRLYVSAEEFLAAGDLVTGCIVTEADLPGKSGVELIETLRVRGSTQAVVVIAARGDVATAVNAMRAGAADFLEKPFSQSVLIDRVSELAGGAAGDSGQRH